MSKKCTFPKNLDDYEANDGIVPCGYHQFDSF